MSEQLLGYLFMYGFSLLISHGYIDCTRYPDCTVIKAPRVYVEHGIRRVRVPWVWKGSIIEGIEQEDIGKSIIELSKVTP